MEKKDAKIEYELNSLSNGCLPDPDKILWKARVQMRKDAARARGGFLPLSEPLPQFLLCLL